jgi:hypothetical protein
MRNFYLSANSVDVVNNNGSIFTIYFNEHSGKVYYRNKIDTVVNIKHPGIYLGKDINGTGYFLHNHYHYGKAHITTQADFTKGEKIYLYNEMCSNSPREVIRIGLNEVLRGERYKPISYNCQTFTNTACHSIRKSDDAERMLAGVAGVALLFVFLGALFGGGSK